MMKYARLESNPSEVAREDNFVCLCSYKCDETLNGGTETGTDDRWKDRQIIVDIMILISAFCYTNHLKEKE